MTVRFCAQCTLCLGENRESCTRHDRKNCRHHDCAQYISLDSKLCCEPGHPLPEETLRPWIEVSIWALYIGSNYFFCCLVVYNFAICFVVFVVVFGGLFVELFLVVCFLCITLNQP